MVCKVASAVPKFGEMRSLSQLEALWDGFPMGFFSGGYRPGKQVNNGKHTKEPGTSPCFMDRSTISTGPFSIAMLAYQSVVGVLVPIQRMICRMFRKYGKETRDPPESMV